MDSRSARLILLAALLAATAYQAALQHALGAVPLFREEVSVDYNSAVDLSGSGLTYSEATGSYSPDYSCAASTIYPRCATFQVSLVEASTGSVIMLEFYFTEDGDMAGIGLWTSSSSMVIIANPPIPTSLASITSGYTRGSETVTFYTYVDGSLVSTDTYDVRVEVDGPTSEKVEWNHPGGSVEAELEAYKVIVYEYMGGRWVKDLELHYSPAAGTILYIYLSDSVELSGPTITAETPPPSGGSQPTPTTVPQTSTSTIGTQQPATAPQSGPQAPPEGQSQAPGTAGQPSEESDTASIVAGILFLLGIGGAGYYVGARRRRGPRELITGGGTAGGAAGQPSHSSEAPTSPAREGHPGAAAAGQPARPRLEVDTDTIQVAPAAVAQVPVRVSCPGECRVRPIPPEGAGILVEPVEASVSGEDTLTFTLRLGSGVEPGVYNVAFATEPPSASPASLRLVVVGPAEGAPEGLIRGYRIIGRLGSGGFSTVYLAERVSDGLKVALKLPRIELGETLGAQLAEAFVREAETWSRLKHPNIVEVVDYGTKPLPYIAVEYMPGGSLRSRLEPGKPLPLREAVNVAIGVGEALSYAHHMGVVHRDIKPENVLLDEKGNPKLTDFGLAKVMLQASVSSGAGFKGTLLYAAPEQVDPETYGQPDWRTDIWQYGALLYEILTGRPPFTAENPIQLIREITSSEPPRPSQLNPEVPEWLDEIVAKCLAKRKEGRWRSIDVILEKMQENMAGEG